MPVEELVLLFKSPAGIYGKALLAILGLPNSTRYSVTTYEEKWVPSDIFKQPKALEGKKSILVCADIGDRNDKPQALNAVYPVRELKIVRSGHLGKALELIVETGGYIECRDYAAYLTELKKSASTLPPEEHGYIAIDHMRNLTLVPP